MKASKPSFRLIYKPENFEFLDKRMRVGLFISESIHRSLATQISGDELTCQYLYEHSLSVKMALSDLMDRIVSLPLFQNDSRADYFLRFGLMRRLMMIKRSFETLIRIAQPNRRAHLDPDEMIELEAALNTIYLNIIGCLDNAAWVIHWLKETEDPKDLTKISILGAVTKLFLSEEEFAEIERHRSWVKSVAMLRHPVAHRIPITVPPSVQSPSDTQRRREIDSLLTGGNTEIDIATFKRLHQEREMLGEFAPLLWHDPHEGLFPIYPSVALDIAHMVSVLGVVVTKLESTSLV